MKENLMRYLSPEKSIPLYLLGTAVITLLLQLVVDLTNEPGVWRGSHTLTIIVAAITLISLGIVWYQNRPKRLYLVEERKPRPREGLILLVSLHKAAAPHAIRYHQKSLRHCWLIHTRDSAGIATAVAADFAGSEIEFHYGDEYEVYDDEASFAYRVVERILTEKASLANIQTINMIADITGGSKPMTAGLFAACVDHGCAMQYILTEKDEQGRARQNIYGEPVQIHATFRS